MEMEYECGYCPAAFPTFEDRMNHYLDDCPAREETLTEMRLRLDREDSNAEERR